jgi:hypothetical protein
VQWIDCIVSYVKLIPPSLFEAGLAYHGTRCLDRRKRNPRKG